jgi:hypothetical protein
MSDPTLGGTARQVSGRDSEGRWILSVLAKRTYTFQGDACRASGEQLPLIAEPLIDEDSGLLLADIDVFPFKLLTDVVVLGTTYNSTGQQTFKAAVRVGKITRWIQVWGDRKATLTSDGRIVYSPPKIVASVPLSYQFAYGGRDIVAEAKYGNPHAVMRPYLGASVSDAMMSAASPHAYPRNPSGRGYIIEPSREAIEAVDLPNLEDAGDPLTPTRLIVGSARRWPLQPIPASFGWIRYAWFPRIADLGFVPDYDPDVDLAQAPEVRFGYGKSDLWKRKISPEDLTLRGTNGAALALRLPYLAGNEEVEALNLHPRSPRIHFRLPGERPRMWVDGRNGNLVETKPIIHTVVLEPDLDRVSLVWRGCALALRPYLDEIATMPFRVVW